MFGSSSSSFLLKGLLFSAGSLIKNSFCFLIYHNDFSLISQDTARRRFLSYYTLLALISLGFCFHLNEQVQKNFFKYITLFKS
ncbi:hypothetical protein CHH85_01335 [Bacillus subtilis]|nr:hypothetical protein CHI03_00840 [Bacillus subtilis]PAE70024.1 hypothetical protein CHH85_01335 [Bacillus subtilis]